MEKGFLWRVLKGQLGTTHKQARRQGIAGSAPGASRQRTARLRCTIAFVNIAFATSAAVGVTSTVSAQPFSAVPQAAAVARAFSCTGIISRYYTRQTVNGTLTALRPSNVSVINYAEVVVYTKAAPAKTNGWWDGYWKTTYQLNQWNLGKAADGTVYHLMLPDTAMGGSFQGLLVSEFGGGSQGNWQNWMSCTATPF